MAFLLAAVLIALSAGVLVYPFLKRRGTETAGALMEHAGTEDRELESLVEDMRILQLDHQSGSIPDGLYEEQLRAYRLRGASLLRQQAEDRSTEADKNLEQEILMVRLASQSQDLEEATESAPDPHQAPER